MRTLLVIGYVWPEPDSSAAGTRMIQLLEFFQKEGYSIYFGTTAAETPVMADLVAMGIQKFPLALNNSSFDRSLAELEPDVVLFDRFMMEEQFGWRVREVCPGALRILDTEDLHFLRKARQEAVLHNQELTPELLRSDTAKREIASIYRSDLSLIISKPEWQILVEEFQLPSSLLCYLPFMEEMPSAHQLHITPGFDQRKDFISIGNFRHAPNLDAVLQLKREIWPLIRRELPGVSLQVYGAYENQQVSQWHNEKEGFLIKGRAESAHEVLGNARVILAPLRFGAGLKGKFFDAMKAGTPFVTTPIGSEGMNGKDLLGLEIGENPVEFAKAAVRLYREKESWVRMQEAGYRVLLEFSGDQARNSFRDKLNSLLTDPSGHRLANFTGEMLHHHQMAGTRYLSKYIEMKNRLKIEPPEN